MSLPLALGSFVNAVLHTAATVYSFYLASTVAVIVSRFEEPGVERPFRIWGYPLVPLAFAGVCAFLIYSAITYKPSAAVVSGVLLLLGLPLWRRSRRPTTTRIAHMRVPRSLAAAVSLAGGDLAGNARSARRITSPPSARK
jgi:hypothetical protein